MPIFEYTCIRDGYSEEKLFSYERSKLVEVICPQCSDAMVKLISMPAKTANAWHGNWTDGLDSTYYSSALGRKVANKREEAKILESRGFIAESDLGTDWMERKGAEVVQKRNAQDAKTEIYNKVLAETGDAAKAVETAFPARECLDGTLDKLYDEKISI
tara:strand:- start:567 stop:1043 length:477 start_codon:yes stop_codon:yes gene_type:complete